MLNRAVVLVAPRVRSQMAIYFCKLSESRSRHAFISCSDIMLRKRVIYTKGTSRSLNDINFPRRGICWKRKSGIFYLIKFFI